MRVWFARAEADAPARWRADSDPILGRALRLIYGDPSRHWTIASLAAAASVSRASLGRRFNDLVGEPPIAFLTSWRLALAADLLRAPDTSLSVPCGIWEPVRPQHRLQACLRDEPQGTSGPGRFSSFEAARSGPWIL